MLPAVSACGLNRRLIAVTPAGVVLLPQSIQTIDLGSLLLVVSLPALAVSSSAETDIPVHEPPSLRNRFEATSIQLTSPLIFFPIIMANFAVNPVQRGEGGAKKGVESEEVGVVRNVERELPFDRVFARPFDVIDPVQSAINQPKIGADIEADKKE